MYHITTMNTNLCLTVTHNSPSEELYESCLLFLPFYCHKFLTLLLKFHHNKSSTVTLWKKSPINTGQNLLQLPPSSSWTTSTKPNANFMDLCKCIWAYGTKPVQRNHQLSKTNQNCLPPRSFSVKHNGAIMPGCTQIFTYSLKYYRFHM